MASIDITFSPEDTRQFRDGNALLAEAKARARALAKEQGARRFDDSRYSAEWADGNGRGALTVSFPIPEAM